MCIGVSSSKLEEEQRGEETILNLKYFSLNVIKNFVAKYTQFRVSSHTMWRTFPFDLFILKNFLEIYFRRFVRVIYKDL